MEEGRQGQGWRWAWAEASGTGPGEGGGRRDLKVGGSTCRALSLPWELGIEQISQELVRSSGGEGGAGVHGPGEAGGPGEAQEGKEPVLLGV